MMRRWQFSLHVRMGARVLRKDDIIMVVNGQRAQKYVENKKLEERTEHHRADKYA